MITLVLGGARSGKSEVAERLAGAAGAALSPPEPVTYLATGSAATRRGDEATDLDLAQLDDDMAARIAIHRSRRPQGWTTVEVAGSDLLEAVRVAAGPLLIDSLTTWVGAAEDFAVDVDGLCVALADHPGRCRSNSCVVVSDEVGLGVHPSTGSGRRFRDALGRVNQAVAAVADDVWLVVAGRVLRLDPAPW